MVTLEDVVIGKTWWCGHCKKLDYMLYGDHKCVFCGNPLELRCTYVAILPEDQYIIPKENSTYVDSFCEICNTHFHREDYRSIRCRCPKKYEGQSHVFDVYEIRPK